jgi:hypothetical protein
MHDLLLERLFGANSGWICSIKAVKGFERQPRP